MNTKEIKYIKRNYYKKIRKDEIKRTGDLILRSVETTLKVLTKNKNRIGFIGVYWPLNGEVDLRPLKHSQNYSLALPSTTNHKEMTYHEWSNIELKKDINGIPSPLSQACLSPEQIELLLIPALAIDHSGYRLGYGGGYFDRLRSNPYWRKIQAIAILPEACVSQTLLPQDEWDIPLDGWISEKGFRKVPIT